MTAFTRTLAAATTLLALGVAAAGCGAGGGSSYSSAADVAKDLGCASYKADTGDLEIFVSDSGSCRFGGHSTTVYWFKSSDNRASWVKAAASFGGNVAYGSNWVVGCETQTRCADVTSKLGGSLG